MERVRANTTPKKVLIIAGWGDRTDYIEHTTRSWPERFNLQPTIYQFGTNQSAALYPKLWENFEKILLDNKPEILIGISFGGLISARALAEHPKIVQKQVSIATPFQGALRRSGSFPMLEAARQQVNESVMTTDNSLAISSRFYDSVAPPKTMLPEAASHQRIWIPGHTPSILGALTLGSRNIARFIHR